MTPKTAQRAAIGVFLLCTGLLSPGPSGALPAQDVRPINNREYFPAVLDLLDHAADNIRIIMYLAQWYDNHPESFSNRLLEALAKARKRGVDVEVILERPGTEDERSKDLSTKNQRVEKFLREADIKVFEDSPHITTHAKILVVDRRYTVLGSTNWTFAALARNNETAAVVDSQDVAREYMNLFDRIKAQP